MLVYEYDFENPESAFTREHFGRLLEYCCSACDVFSLTVGWAYYANEDIVDSLAPYLWKEIETTHWFSYYTSDKQPLKVRLYPVCTETKEILSAYYPNLFRTDDIPSAEFPRLEDLCFFRGGKLLLGSVAHEHICHAYPADGKVEAAFYDCYPGWKHVPDDGEQIVLK